MLRNFTLSRRCSYRKTDRMKLLIVAVVLIPTCSMFARVFESPVQCYNRYGKPLEGFAIGTKQPTTTKTYPTKEKMIVWATFRDGQAVTMKYQRSALGGGQWALKPLEISALLAAEGGEQKWQYLGTEVSFLPKKYWKTEDGKLVAYLDGTGMVLTIEDAKEPARRAADEEERRKKDVRDLRKF